MTTFISNLETGTSQLFESTFKVRAATETDALNFAEAPFKAHNRWMYRERAMKHIAAALGAWWYDDEILIEGQAYRVRFAKALVPVIQGFSKHFVAYQLIPIERSNYLLSFKSTNQAEQYQLNLYRRETFNDYPLPKLGEYMQKFREWIAAK